MKRFLFCTVLLTSVWPWPSTTIAGSASPMAKEFTSDIVEGKNLAYVTHGGLSQTLDLYAPKKAKEVPLIVWIHGGGFLFGSKEGFPVEPVPLHLLLEGYAVASINYRLSSEAVFPAQLEDCKAAGCGRMPMSSALIRTGSGGLGRVCRRKPGGACRDHR